MNLKSCWRCHSQNFTLNSRIHPAAIVLAGGGVLAGTVLAILGGIAREALLAGFGFLLVLLSFTFLLWRQERVFCRGCGLNLSRQDSWN